MKILYILLLLSLFGCSNVPQERLQDDIWEAQKTERKLAMEHLDKSVEYLNKDDIDACQEEFHAYVKHYYTSQVLWDIWIKEVTK